MEYSLDHTEHLIKASIILHSLYTMERDGTDVGGDIPETIHRKPTCYVHPGDGARIRGALTDFSLSNPL